MVFMTDAEAERAREVQRGLQEGRRLRGRTGLGDEAAAVAAAALEPGAEAEGADGVWEAGKVPLVWEEDGKGSLRPDVSSKPRWALGREELGAGLVGPSMLVKVTPPPGPDRSVSIIPPGPDRSVSIHGRLLDRRARAPHPMLPSLTSLKAPKSAPDELAAMTFKSNWYPLCIETTSGDISLKAFSVIVTICSLLVQRTCERSAAS